MFVNWIHISPYYPGLFNLDSLCLCKEEVNIVISVRAVHAWFSLSAFWLVCFVSLVWRYMTDWTCICVIMWVFLAPPAERQRSFSNTDLSVVRLSVCLSVCPSVRPSVKIEGGRGLSQKRFSNFSSFLAWSFFGVT